jgi:glycosyltransferase involved in cell wall biosynthesis
MTIGIDELKRRIEEHENVSLAEVEALLAGSAEERASALWELHQSELRAALDRLVLAAKATKYSDPRVSDLFNALDEAGDNPWAGIQLLRDLGIFEAGIGDVGSALGHLEGMIGRADTVTHGGFNARARRATAYFHDRLAEEAIASLATRFEPLSDARFPASPPRCLIVMTEILDENAPALVVRAWARGLRKLGWEIAIVTTNDWNKATPSNMLASFKSEGFPVYSAEGATHAELLDAVLAIARAHPADVAYYCAFPADMVAKLVSCIGLAPAQVFHNFAYEPHVGKFDFMVNGVAPEQETHTNWPGRSRYLGSLVAMAPELDAAPVFDRNSIGIPPGALMLGTYGRMVKCLLPEYLDSVTAILRAVPNAYLVLAGPVSRDEFETLTNAFERAGVSARVRILGSRMDDAPALVKATDLYCDTYPFPGGQTILDAMHVGVPIVAMRKIVDRNLDPSGFGSTTAIADVLLGSVLELAAPGDCAAYARIAIRYLEDPAYRHEIGAKLRRSTSERFSHEGHMRALDALFREAIALHAPPSEGRA